LYNASQLTELPRGLMSIMYLKSVVYIIGTNYHTHLKTETSWGKIIWLGSHTRQVAGT
jgi:hypothetical protein